MITALLLLQTLGVLHAIVHHAAPGPVARQFVAVALPRPAPAAVHGPAITTKPAAADQAPARPLGWAGALFAGHDAGSSACALYDQLVQPVLPVDTACAANPAFAPPLPAEPPRVGRLAPQAVGFLARGPPAAARDLST